MAAVDARTEIEHGKRFAFGDNWRAFLDVLDDDRIASALRSLQEMLGRSDLAGLRFLDAGCGSGLFSLAARNLGASVVSFDFDPASVACTEEVKRRYRPGDPDWHVHQASVLDREFLCTLGTFDVVYSWGMLHHTGAMWQAMANVEPLVRPGGLLFVSIYNDQGLASRAWTVVKRRYNTAGPLGKKLMVAAAAIYFSSRTAVATALALRSRPWRHGSTARVRGMSRRHDIVDWVGGYPFEVAKPEEVFDFYRERGLELRRLVTCGGGLGCNEFVFERTSGTTAAKTASHSSRTDARE